MSDVAETAELTIDKDLSQLLIPLTESEEKELRKGLECDGCLDPIKVWADHNTILDGHNRFRICKELGIPFETVELKIGTLEDARRWVIRSQLGRRNLTPDRMHYYLGELYELAKAAHGGKREKKASGQNDQMTTAEQIAETAGVSEATVRRDARQVRKLRLAPQEDQAAVRSCKKRLRDVVGAPKKPAKGMKRMSEAEDKANAALAVAFDYANQDIMLINVGQIRKFISEAQKTVKAFFEYKGHPSGAGGEAMPGAYQYAMKPDEAREVLRKLIIQLEKTTDIHHVELSPHDVRLLVEEIEGVWHELFVRKGTQERIDPKALRQSRSRRNMLTTGAACPGEDGEPGQTPGPRVDGLGKPITEPQVAVAFGMGESMETNRLAAGAPMRENHE